MKGLLIRWVVSAIALYATAWLAQVLGLGIRLQGLWTPLFAVAVLAIVNVLIRPLVIILTLPLNCLTLGLVTVLINALMFWLVGQILKPGFEVTGFLAALFGSVVMGIINGILSQLVTSRE